MNSRKEIKRYKRIAEAIDRLQVLIHGNDIKIPVPAMTNPNDVLTIAETSAMLKLKPVEIYDLIRCGELHIEKDKGLKISISSLNSFLTRIANDYPF